jgi:hypothetical protein
MNEISKVAKTAGNRTGSVTVRIVVQTPAPAVCAASSKEGSMERKAAAMRRKGRLKLSTPSAQIMPPML